LAFGGCGLLYQIGLTGFGNQSNWFWWNRSGQFWEQAWPVCAQSWHLFWGSLHICRGSSCMLWWFVLFAWAWFCLGCVEPLPFPKGSENCVLQVILLFAFPWLSIACSSFFYSFLFFFLFSLITKCLCCQCTHQGGDWGPRVVQGPVDGRSLVWSVIDNVVWTDSWLSIVAGCSLTGVGAGAEEVLKVITGEASRCGEDK
jgi:hypothetical protein